MRRERMARRQLYCGCRLWADGSLRSGCPLGEMLQRFERPRALRRHLEDSLQATLVPRRGPRRKYQVAS